MKIRLNVEHLEVESFDTGGGDGIGTVAAHQQSPPTSDPQTDTEDTCLGQTCIGMQTCESDGVVGASCQAWCMTNLPENTCYDTCQGYRFTCSPGCGEGVSIAAKTHCDCPLTA